jgi:hypothetical protein
VAGRTNRRFKIMVETAAKGHGVEHGPPTITVIVRAPRSVEPRNFTFEKTAPVGEAAREAATAFEYSGGNPTFAKNGSVLDRAKPLVAAGVRDGDELELVDAGGGV